MKYKAAVIGCGRIGCEFEDDPRRRYISSHAGAYNAVEDVSLVALVDKDEKKLKKYQVKYDVSAYTDSKEMAKKENPDIVSICTPTDTHYKVIKEIVDLGVKAIFCEKPIASNLQDAHQIVKLCKENNVILQIDHQRRFCKFHQEVRRFLSKEKAQHVACYYTAGLLNTGTHMFDLLRFFLGDAEWAMSIDKKFSPSGIIKLKNGVFCSIHGCEVNKFLIFEMDIITEENRLRLTHSGFDLDFYTTQDSTFFTGYKELYESTPPIDNTIKRDFMVNGVKHLVECIKEQKKSISSGEDGLKALELILAFKKVKKVIL